MGSLEANKCVYYDLYYWLLTEAIGNLLKTYRSLTNSRQRILEDVREKWTCLGSGGEHGMTDENEQEWRHVPGLGQDLQKRNMWNNGLREEWEESVWVCLFAPLSCL